MDGSEINEIQSELSRIVYFKLELKEECNTATTNSLLISTSTTKQTINDSSSGNLHNLPVATSQFSRYNALFVDKLTYQEVEITWHKYFLNENVHFC